VTVLKEAGLNYGALPLLFVRNEGQFEPEVRYCAQGKGFRCVFEAQRMTLALIAADRSDAPDASGAQGVVLEWKFADANPSTEPQGAKEGGARFHYLKGGDPSRHLRDAPAYREVAYPDIWPGIDAVVRGSAGKLKFDWIVKPGAGAGDIRLCFAGAEEVRLDEDGSLVLGTPHGDLIDEKPVAYQEIEGRTTEVECRYVVHACEDGSWLIGYETSTPYDRSHPLVIDPSILYSTFLGGSGIENGRRIAADDAGNAYVLGTTTSANFPVTPGAFQSRLSGEEDLFVAKLNPTGTALIYSTYIGGSGREIANGIALDPSGQVYITGTTFSSDYPTTPGAFQPAPSSARAHAFVTKLSADGSTLVYSTLLGGTGGDSGLAIALGFSGEAYVAGQTDSPDFPVTPGALITTNVGEVPTGFVTKLNAGGSALVYSTYLGGQGGTSNCNGIAVDPSGNAYIAGQTVAPDFPTTPGAYQTSLQGDIDAFITKLNPSGTALVYSTILGSTLNDDAEAIAIDDAGNAYVTGTTTSPDFPVTPGAFTTPLGIRRIFVTKLNPTGSTLIYSALIGGNGSNTPFDMTINSFRSILVTGTTTSTDYPVTPDAFQHSRLGGNDAFVTVLNPTGSFLEYSTYLGGTGASDDGYGIAVDPFDNIYVTGVTFSADFPVTPGVVQPFRNSIDAFVTKFGEAAELFLEKFAERFEVRPGEHVGFHIFVRNGPVPLSNVLVRDTLTGLFQFIPELPPFQNFGFNTAFFVPPDHPSGILVNVAFAKADQLPGEVVAEAHLLVVNDPALSITKTANPRAGVPGATIVYTITIVNEGNVDLFNVRVFDPTIGLDQSFANIPVGSTVIIDWPFVIPPNAQAGLTIPNVVEVRADNLPQPESVGTIVEVLPAPRLEIEKSADRIVVFPGETLNFSITLTNTGNTELTNIEVTDDIVGFDEVVPRLGIGEQRVLTIPFLVPLEVPPRAYTNLAVATSDQAPQVSDSVDVTVAASPDIGIRKLVSTTVASPGQSYTYTLVLNNIGNVPITGIRIVDPLLGVDEALPDLAVGQRFERSIPFTVPADALIGSDIVNELTVQTAEAGTQRVEATVTVIGFGLSLQKTADRPLALPGETISYTLTVGNLRDFEQMNIVLEDALLGIGETVASLPVGATIVRTGTFVVPADAPGGSVITNEFAVSSDQTPVQRTQAKVVVRPAADQTTTLTVRKLPDRDVTAPGETIRYTVEIKNVGVHPATNVTVSDSLTGTAILIPVILPGETEIALFAFDVPLTAVQGTVFANRVTVDWLERPADAFPATSEARVLLALPATLVEIQNEVQPEAAKPGDTVTKTIRVTNASDRILTNVRVIDLLVRFNTRIAALAPGESREFALPFTIPADAVGGTEFRNNVAVFSDQTPLQQGAVFIETQTLPGAALAETVNRPEGRPGETVFFTVRFGNTGNVVLLNLRLAAPLIGVDFQTDRFEIEANETIRIPFELPDTDEDLVLVSPATLTADNLGTLRTSASVRVLVEEE